MSAEQLPGAASEGSAGAPISAPPDSARMTACVPTARAPRPPAPLRPLPRPAPRPPPRGYGRAEASPSGPPPPGPHKMDLEETRSCKPTPRARSLSDALPPAAPRATHRAEGAVLESGSGCRARAARCGPNNDQRAGAAAPPPTAWLPARPAAPKPPGLSVGAARSRTRPAGSCQLILPTWPPRSSRLRAPTARPARSPRRARRQRASARPPARSPSRGRRLPRHPRPFPALV